MPQPVIVTIVLQLDGNGQIEKLVSPKPPHQSRNGNFIWFLKNDVGRTISVDLRNFDPPGYVEFGANDLPVSIKKDKQGVVTGKVIKANADATTVHYVVYVDGQNIDPDLIIDGDGGDVPPGQKKGGAKKKGGKKR